ncbi:MAG: hypothetical protein NT062_16415, partial [Proteobacteria bacterium]|nr:hypothetical protein [Pseudomonadota bacterium]
MASKSGLEQTQKVELIEESLEELDKTLDRLKALYEQYFLGTQKQAPSHIHADVERKIRDLAQLNIRNTAARYRFNMLQQKFGSYNAYWRRTTRQIENGTYTRSLSRLGRKAALTGEAIPEEILASMPKLMREQILRDRAAAVAQMKRRAAGTTGELEREEHTDAELVLQAQGDVATPAPAIATRDTFKRTATGALLLDDNDDFDLDAFFAEAQRDEEVLPARPATQAIRPEPTPPRAATQATPTVPARAATQATPTVPARVPTTTVPTVPPRVPTTTVPTVAGGPPPIPRQGTQAMPPPIPGRPAASQAIRPLPFKPGSSEQAVTAAPPTVGGRATTVVPRERDTAVGPAPTQRPPPGMTDADVNALYSKYVKAKEMVGEPTGPQTREKLLRTINAQAPKIMEQYKASGVDFSIVV